MMKVWLNGTISDGSDAKISVLDHGLLYGDGIFEGIRATRGMVVDLNLHLDRLERSAKGIHLSIPARRELADVVMQTLTAHGKAEAYVRLLVTRGPGALGIDTTGCVPNLVCIADEIRLFPEETRARGVNLATSSLRRPPADVLDPCVKSLNYLNNVLAKYEAKQRGADEALLLNARGTIAEASGANIFIRAERRLLTPACSDGALPGITRRRVLRVANTLGLETAEQTLTRYDLMAADEAFLTGTGAGLVPVRSLDGETIGGRGEREPSFLPRLERALLEYVLTHGTPIPGLERSLENREVVA
jgi:branched-chain amino acid aminotransferase